MTQLLTVKQVAQRIARHPLTVRQMIQAGEFGPEITNGRTGQGKRYRVDQAELERWIEARKSRAA